MAKHYDQKPERSHKGLPKNGQGVRGGVAYRELSDSYASDKNYPRSLYIGVNVVLSLFAITVLLGLLLVFTPLGQLWQGVGAEADILYTLEFYDVNGDLSAAPAEGTTLIDPQTGKALGEIVQVTSRPYVMPSFALREGTGEDSSLSTTAKIVSVTVSLCAHYEKGVGYTVHDMRIAKGLSYTVSFGGSVATGTCVSIEKRW